MLLNRLLSLAARRAAPLVPGHIIGGASMTQALEAARGRAPVLRRSLATTVKITFVEEQGETTECEAELGETLLDVALDNDVEIEGACGGELACSTCHIIMKQEDFDRLEEPDEEEEDMLDLAWGLTDTSRLCCQIKAEEWMAGMEVVVPDETTNMME